MDDDVITMNTFKLTDIPHDPAFWASVLVGLPILIMAYMQALSGESDIQATTLVLSANPITLYLLARQWPRNTAISAAALFAADNGIELPTVPDYLPSDEGDEA